jgi:ribosome-binding ATPase YchF (GTP1/OBG family)
MDGLRAGQMVRAMALEAHQREHLAAVDLLTNKPAIYVANVSEGDLPEGGPLAARLCERVAARGDEVIVLSAQLESELGELEPQEAREYLAVVGLEATGLERFIWAGYRLLDYITFFTTTGGKEVHAWNLQRGQSAVEAAGKVHTDLARGFIRAEVVHYDDLIAAGSIAHAREAGRLYVEGRDYVVQDGDILHIRFNV